jgi:hypothetical protein
MRIRGRRPDGLGPPVLNAPAMQRPCRSRCKPPGGWGHEQAPPRSAADDAGVVRPREGRIRLGCGPGRRAHHRPVGEARLPADDPLGEDRGDECLQERGAAPDPQAGKPLLQLGHQRVNAGQARRVVVGADELGDPVERGCRPGAPRLGPRRFVVRRSEDATSPVPSACLSLATRRRCASGRSGRAPPPRRRGPSVRARPTGRRVSTTRSLGWPMPVRTARCRAGGSEAG